MRTPIRIRFNAAAPPAGHTKRAPFFPTYQLAYASPRDAFFHSQSYSAILHQYDAYDVYITVLEVKTRHPAILPIAIPVETLHRDLHWLYQLKGSLAIEATHAGARHRHELAAGWQSQLYCPPLRGTLRLDEPHTLSIAIAAKANWLVRYQSSHKRPVEKLVSLLRQRADQCAMAHGGKVEPAMPYLAELLSLPLWEGEPMDVAIAQPVSQLVRLARGRDAEKREDPEGDFVMAIRRQVDNHIRAGNALTVASLARQNGMGNRTLGDRYRRASGQRLQSYIVTRRIAEGLRLLVEEGAAVGEAALAVGYAETSVFSKQFKKLHGRSPRMYLKALEASGATTGSPRAGRQAEK